MVFVLKAVEHFQLDPSEYADLTLQEGANCVPGAAQRKVRSTVRRRCAHVAAQVRLHLVRGPMPSVSGAWPSSSTREIPLGVGAEATLAEVSAQAKEELGK